MYKSGLMIRLLSITTILYLVSLLTVVSNENFYVINRLLFFALIGIFLSTVLLYKIPVKMGRIFFSTIPILIMIILSNIWAVDSSVSLNRTIGIVYYYTGAVIVYLILYNKILSIERIKQSLFLVVVILSITAGYEYYFLGLSRGAGLAENPNNFGLTIVFLCPLIWGIEKVQLKESAIVKWFIVIALVNAVVVSGGRKVLIASIVIILFFYLNDNGAKIKVSKYTKLFLLLIMLIFFILYFMMNSETLNFLFENLNVVERLFDKEDESVSVRKEMIQTSIKLFREKPILGYGIDNFSVVSQYGTYSHNNYTELLVSVGIAGFMLYYSMYISIVRFSKKVSKKIKKTEIYYLTLFYFLLILVMEIGLVNINSPRIWFMLMMMMILNGSKKK